MPSLDRLDRARIIGGERCVPRDGDDYGFCRSMARDRRHGMNTLIAQLATFAAISAYALGYNWIAEGHGLNPMIAFPLATVLLLLPYMKWTEWR